MVLLLFAAALLLSLPGAASGAGPAIRMRPVDLHAYSPLYSDGSRWAAYQASTTRMRVIDAWTGHVFERPVPGNCQFLSVGVGEMLFTCPPWDQANRTGVHTYYAVEDMATGNVHRITVPVIEGDGSNLLQIGSVWAKGWRLSENTRDGDSSESPLYVNWRTLASVEGSLGESEGSRVRELDLPGLDATLCEPLRRVPTTWSFGFENEERSFVWVAYAPPYAVTGAESRPEGRTLELQRCGSQRRELLERREHPLSEGELQVAAGFVTWPCGPEFRNAYNGDACAVRLFSRGPRWRSRTYVFAGSRAATPYGVQHTASMIYANSQLLTSSEGDEYEIYGAHLP